MDSSKEGARELADLQLSPLLHPPRPPRMNSVIESARQSHEEIDLYEQALAAIFLQTDDSVSARSVGRVSR